MSKKLLYFLLFIFTAISFTSCGDDKDEPAQLSPFNAKGIYFVDYDKDYLEKEDVTLWINDYSIYTLDRYGALELDLSTETNQSIAYYPLSMDVVYEMIGEDYGVDVDENTDFSTFIPNPIKLINYIKSNKSKYRYIAKRYGEIIIFNRTSNVNY